MTDFDDAGQWIGPCEDCGSNHDGYPPGTLGGMSRCLRLQAEALGATHLVDLLDAMERDRNARVEAIMEADWYTEWADHARTCRADPCDVCQAAVGRVLRILG